jgi:hypothetical protein
MKRTREHTQYFNEVIATASDAFLSLSHTQTNTLTSSLLSFTEVKSPKPIPRQEHRYKNTEMRETQLIEKSFA